MKPHNAILAYSFILIFLTAYQFFATAQPFEYIEDGPEIIKNSFHNLPHVQTGAVWPYLHQRKGYPPIGTVYISIISTKQIGDEPLHSPANIEIFIDGDSYSAFLSKIKTQEIQLGYKQLFIVVFPYSTWKKMEIAAQAYWLLEDEAYIFPEDLFSEIGKINIQHYPVDR